MKKLFSVFLVAVFFQAVFAATLEGKVFAWQTLDPLNGAVIDFNSIPKQRIISENGDYRVGLETGSYEIQAVYYESEVPLLYALEEIEIKTDGAFVFDLILFPISEQDLNRLRILGAGKEFPEKQGNPMVLVIVLVLLTIALSLFLFFRKQKQIEEEKKLHRTTEKIEQVVEEKTTEEKKLDKYALEVIDVLKRSGNRLTQKELREKVSVGEAKVSLIVAELEQLGIVKKIKQGRGNIVVLKEKAF